MTPTIDFETLTEACHCLVKLEIMGGWPDGRIPPIFHRIRIEHFEHLEDNPEWVEPVLLAVRQNAVRLIASKEG